VERRLLLNIVISEGAIILKLLACKDQALLVRRALPPILFRIGLDYTLSYLRVAYTLH
jgi:hypothetical protein